MHCFFIFIPLDFFSPSIFLWSADSISVFAYSTQLARGSLRASSYSRSVSPPQLRSVEHTPRYCDFLCVEPLAAMKSLILYIFFFPLVAVLRKFTATKYRCHRYILRTLVCGFGSPTTHEGRRSSSKKRSRSAKFEQILRRRHCQ